MACISHTLYVYRQAVRIRLCKCLRSGRGAAGRVLGFRLHLALMCLGGQADLLAVHKRSTALCGGFSVAAALHVCAQVVMTGS